MESDNENDYKGRLLRGEWFLSDIQNCMPEHLKARREVHDGWQSTGSAVQFEKTHEENLRTFSLI